MTDIRKKLAGKATKLAKERPKQEDHPAATMNDCREGSYYQLDIELIHTDPVLPDKEYDQAELEALVDSIRRNSLYQPLVVRKDERGQIILVVGYRRLKAAKIAGLQKVPAIFTEGNVQEILRMENLQREHQKLPEAAAFPGPRRELPQDDKEEMQTLVSARTAVAISAATVPLTEATPGVSRSGDDVEKFTAGRKNQLLRELQTLVSIIDGLITDGK